MIRPVRFGVLGCADIARRRIVPALRHCPDTQITAVASRDPEKATVFAAEIGCAATDYARMLQRDDVDALYIPLPPGLHEPWVRLALLSGKHVLVEKPMTPTARATASLAALAEERGLVLRENFMFVQHRQHRAVRDAIHMGLLGRPLSLTAAFCIPSRPADDFRYVAGLAGGALVDLGVYPLRLTQFLFGPDITVTGVVSEIDPIRDVDLAGLVNAELAAGVTAQLRYRIGGNYTCEYTVRGDVRTVRVERAFTPPADWIPKVTFNDGGALTLPAEDQVSNSVAAFAKAVRANDPVAERSWHAAAVRTGELLDDVRAAASMAGSAGRRATG